MSVLIYIDAAGNSFKKAAYETLSYGAAIAALLNTTADAVICDYAGTGLELLGDYGVKRVYHVTNAGHFDAQIYTNAVAQVAATTGAKVIVCANNVNGKAIAPRLSVRLKAGLVAGAVTLPDIANGSFVVKKPVFSGKAFANVSLQTGVKIITLNSNVYPIKKTGSTAEVVAVAYEGKSSAIKVVAINKLSGGNSLSEAEIVISGGKGLKGPENWGLIEELAQLLDGAVACTRAVSDAHWRPHHEHVGQTGLSIAPNLYFAVGISGAIQHLGGVNRSKTIVVINKDPEAPFFKVADYGIVGDAFDVMPQIIEAARKLKKTEAV